ncbi:MAG: hypothetical protein II864_02640 [Prevotella sp.]|nr:hypothetical protein [Prevotella sp.]
MKKIYLSVALLASLVFGACKSDSDSDNDTPVIDNNAAYTETTVSVAPTWQIDWNHDQQRPDWKEPDGSIYENWTILKVQIEEALRPYASSGDLMALFVNGELRGLASPAVIVSTGQTDNGKFLMKAYGNESGTETVNMSLKYYCQQLKHIFTLTDDINLNSDESTGIDEAYIPEFTYGSDKYPVVKTVVVESLLTKVGITPVEDNVIGAFVGEECRGTVTLSASGRTELIIYGRTDGESVTLKYHDAAKGVIYTIADTVKL